MQTFCKTMLSKPNKCVAKQNRFAIIKLLGKPNNEKELIIYFVDVKKERIKIDCMLSVCVLLHTFADGFLFGVIVAKIFNFWRIIFILREKSI